MHAARGSGVIQDVVSSCKCKLLPPVRTIILVLLESVSTMFCDIEVGSTYVSSLSTDSPTQVGLLRFTPFWVSDMHCVVA